VTKRTRFLVGALGVLAVAALAAFFFFRYQLHKSFPQTSGTLIVPGLLAPVRIARDEYGVPRIDAASEHDAMVALGVVHAQDRLWQMDMQRRAAQGRLSEIFGTVTVPFDRMFRIVGLLRISEAIERQLPDDTRRRLQWYSDGVNAWRAASSGALPVEFDLLRYDPEKWTPLHSILVGRLLAWELNLSWWTDVTYGSLVSRLGNDIVAEILPTFPASVPPTVPAETWRKYADAGSVYMRTARDYRRFMGRPLAQGGSNAWAVAPSKSTTGGALLANDTHLHLSLPAQWYELGFSAPGVNVHGMTIPGVPGVVVGRNDSIAWGVTNLMADDADFFIERIDQTDSGKSWYNNGWQRLTVLEEDIMVRDDTTRTLKIRLTRNGPIVTDIQTPLQHSRPPFVASMRWTGTEPDDQTGTFLRLNRARNWAEFTAALKEFTVPGQNFVYADVRGNIGYYCAARLPIRRDGKGLFPRPGWEPASGWNGFVPFDQLPHLFNPPSGYVASANNRVVDDHYPYYISDLWEPPSRIMRLHETLGAAGARFSVREMQQLQNDTYSLFAQDMLPYLLRACRDSVLGREHAEQVREYLSNWNCCFGREDIATTIFQHWILRVMRNIYEDEMGAELFHDFTMLVNVPIRVTARLLQQGSSRWFDDVRTPAVETRDDIMDRSLREAVDELVSRLGEDTRNWRWGNVHTVTLQHPFGLQKPLDRVFSLGPFPYPGGSTTMMSGEYSITEPFAVTVGPSFRQIFDLANPREHYAVLPSGESGQVYHPHYDDQTPLWLNGAYRTVRTDSGAEGMDMLTLRPGE
jgi:penicillin G amidase